MPGDKLKLCNAFTISEKVSSDISPVTFIVCVPSVNAFISSAIVALVHFAVYFVSFAGKVVGSSGSQLFSLYPLFVGAVIVNVAPYFPLILSTSLPPSVSNVNVTTFLVYSIFTTVFPSAVIFS